MVDAVVVNEFETVRGKRPSPWRGLVYSLPGVGKSTLAASAPGAFFLDLESGLDRIDDAWRTPTKITNYDDIIKWMRWASQNPDVKTVVFDTVDEIDRILSARVLESYNKDNRPAKTVSDIPYGKGGDLLVSEWRGFIGLLDRLHAIGKNILLIGHEQIQLFENPSGANFSFYTVNVHKKVAPVLMSKLDFCFYAKIETIVRDADDNGKGKAFATNRRVLMTTQGGSYISKSRFNLPESVPMDASVFASLQ